MYFESIICIVSHSFVPYQRNKANLRRFENYSWIIPHPHFLSQIWEKSLHSRLYNNYNWINIKLFFCFNKTQNEMLKMLDFRMESFILFHFIVCNYDNCCSNELKRWEHEYPCVMRSENRARTFNRTVTRWLCNHDSNAYTYICRCSVSDSVQVQFAKSLIVVSSSPSYDESCHSVPLRIFVGYLILGKNINHAQMNTNFEHCWKSSGHRKYWNPILFVNSTVGFAYNDFFTLISVSTGRPLHFVIRSHWNFNNIFKFPHSIQISTSTSATRCRFGCIKDMHL